MTSIFTTPQDNVITATSRLIRLLKVHVTQSTLQQILRRHPDYPSLLSVMDALSEWEIKSMGIQVPISQLSSLPLPLIVQIKEEMRNEFVVVESVTKEKITYYLNNESVTKSLTDFAEIYQGTALITEALENAGEEQYKAKHRLEGLKKLRIPAVLIMALSLLGIMYLSVETIDIFTILFSLFSLVGTVVTAGLLWYEVDQQNPVLHKICTSGRNTNCGNVLQSKAAKLGNVISWSEVGFIYFTGGFLSLLLSGMNPNVMYLLGWLTVLAAPYVLFSVYYQWRIAKEWCVLCLAVQGLLVAELALTLGSGVLTVSWEGLALSLWGILIFSFLSPGLVWSVLKPLWIKAEEEKREKTDLFRLKHDSRIFNALLPKQKVISSEEIKKLGITLGKSDAKYQLVKVCNPYCGPCARAHPKIEKILENNPEVSAQIIFTATNEKKDIRRLPAMHLMAIDEKGDKELTKQALEDWYNPKGKDSLNVKTPADRYDVFSHKYPMNGEVQRQGKKLEEMSEWCEKTEISFTPTFFIINANAGRKGFQLPEIYGVEDLKYLLG